MARGRKKERTEEIKDTTSPGLGKNDVIDDNEEVWNIVQAYATDSSSSDKEVLRKCNTDKCDRVAVAAWKSSHAPDQLWDTCEKCQESDFGGWPDDFERPVIAENGDEKEDMDVDEEKAVDDPPANSSKGADTDTPLILYEKTAWCASGTQKSKEEEAPSLKVEQGDTSLEVEDGMDYPEKGQPTGDRESAEDADGEVEDAWEIKRGVSCATL